MKPYRFGFNIWGAASVLAVLLPNIVWALFPPANNPLAQAALPLWLDIAENLARFGSMAALVLIAPNHNKTGRPFFGWLAAGLVAAYYIFWTIYYFGSIIPALLFGMAAAPTLAFIFAAAWRRNNIAVAISSLFFIFHVSGMLFTI